MVQWTSDKDAIVLLGIFEHENITFSNSLLQHIANKIGEGCTPKAVSNRLHIIRSKAQASAAADGALATPDTTPAKPKAASKRGRPSKKATPEDGDGSPKKGKAKRARKAKDDDEEEGGPAAKKVKTEAGGLQDVLNAPKVKPEPEDDDVVGDALDEFDAAFREAVDGDVV